MILLLTLLFVFVLAMAVDRGIKRHYDRVKRFHCPVCRQGSWGSVPPFEQGTCYGCGFQWSRAEDNKYFD